MKKRPPVAPEDRPLRLKRKHWDRELAEAHATIAMLSQQLADMREIIRRLTT